MDERDGDLIRRIQDDQDIVTHAAAENRIIVTNDKDFGDLIFRGGVSCPGVVLLRPQLDNAANRLRIMSAVLTQCPDKLADNFVVATETNIRIRPLPP